MRFVYTRYNHKYKNVSKIVQRFQSHQKPAVHFMDTGLLVQFPHFTHPNTPTAIFPREQGDYSR